MRSRRTAESGASAAGSGLSSSSISPERRPAGRLIVVSGPSGVGKSTIVDALLTRMPARFSVSATTRRARPGESEGIDYHFVSAEAFNDMVEQEELLEWAEYGGNRYGTPRAEVMPHLAGGSDVILDIENEGAKQVKRAHPEAILVFLAPPSLDELERRLRGRGDTDEADIRHRLDVAREQMEEAPVYYDHILVNDEVEPVITRLLSILQPRAGKPPG